MLEKILIKSEKDFLPILSGTCSMIAKLLLDPAPEVKTRLCEFLIRLTGRIGKNIGPHSKAIVNSLCVNIKHSHNKVRKIVIIV